MTDPVSRETPPTPTLAAGVFSSALPLVERYAAILATTGIDRGLIGPREAPVLWERHLVNCGLLAQALPPSGEVADVGSGAGLPGVVLAITRPELDLVLVEPLLRRAIFLQELVDDLSLSNVEVVRSRAEDLHGHRWFTCVTARAVARLDKLAGWTVPLVRRPGDLLAMKGSSAAEEVRETEVALVDLGARVVGVEQYGAEVVETPTTVIRVHVPERSPGRARRQR